MKKYLITSLLMMSLMVSVASAASTDFVADNNITIVSVAGTGVTADMFIRNGSRAESWSYNSDSIQVTYPDATNPFQVSSSDANVVSIRVLDGSGSLVSCTANSAPGTSYAEPTRGSNSIFSISPTNTTCAATAATGGSSGGGGGSIITPVATTTSIATATATACLPGELFSTLTGQACGPQAGCTGGAFSITTGLACVGGTTTTVNTSTTGTYMTTNTSYGGGSPGAFIATSPFTKSLFLGVSDSEVKKLQQFLNSSFDTMVAQSGAGSPGLETSYFGALTKKAVEKFQVKHGIAKLGDLGYGRVGPLTRAKLNKLIGL